MGLEVEPLSLGMGPEIEPLSLGMGPEVEPLSLGMGMRLEVEPSSQQCNLIFPRGLPCHSPPPPPTHLTEDQQFNDEKSYLIKQIKEMQPTAASEGATP